MSTPLQRSRRVDAGPGLRGLIAASFTAVLLFLLGWYVSTALLLAFMAVLFAIFAQGIAYAIANRTRLPYWACCALVILAGFTIIATAIALRAPAVADQIETLQQQLPQALQDLRAASTITTHKGSVLCHNLHSVGEMSGEGQVPQQAVMMAIRAMCEAAKELIDLL